MINPDSLGLFREGVIKDELSRSGSLSIVATCINTIAIVACMALTHRLYLKSGGNHRGFSSDFNVVSGCGNTQIYSSLRELAPP
jgi:hypothetical protein